MAERIRAPFLIFHGSADRVVRPEQSESLQTILDQNGVPNERVVFPGEGHDIDHTRQGEVFDAVRDWFLRVASTATPLATEAGGRQ
jgi:dipeptidyl aminopeptidase/acylaminoacyl peptidase